MKKSLLLAVAVLALCLTACKKDDDSGRRLTHFTAGMERVAGQQNAKVYLDNDLIKWKVDDCIVVCNGDDYDFYIATPNAADPTWAEFAACEDGLDHGPYKAVYPEYFSHYYPIDSTIKIHSEQYEVDNGIDEDFPMYAESPDGDQFQFKNLCGVLKIHLQQEGVTVSSIEIITEQYITGYFEVHSAQGIPSMNVSEDDIGYAGNSITGHCATPQDIGGDGRDFYIYLPPSPDGGYNMQIAIYQPDSSCCIKSCNGVVVERSKYTNITTNALTFVGFVAPEGALSGLFTINYDGEKVAFAPGNLVATTTGGAPSATNTAWTFHEHQYDMLGSSNDVNGTCDLFGWSTTNTYFGLSASEDISSYGGNHLDWGYATGQGWYAPTVYQWNYIFYNRPNHENLAGPGRIEVSPGQYVKGNIALPDNWVQPSGCTFTPFDLESYTVSYDDNTYTLAQWALMEANGALFLPLAGYRIGSTFFAGDHWGSHEYSYYWSLDMNFTSSTSSTCWIVTNEFPGSQSMDRHMGFPVRMAKAAVYAGASATTKAVRPKQDDKPVVGSHPMRQHPAKMQRNR